MSGAGHFELFVEGGEEYFDSGQLLVVSPPDNQEVESLMISSSNHYGNIVL